MASSLTAVDLLKTQDVPTTPWGYLPPSMRVLFIGHNAKPRADRSHGWLADALGADSGSEVHLQHASGVAEGLALLRDQVYDAVLIWHGRELNALELLDALRAGTSDEQPIIVLGHDNEPQMAALCYEAGGDDYINVDSTTTRALLWRLARAIERHQLLAENRRLRQSQRHQLELDHDEAERLLAQQRSILDGLESIRSDHQGLEGPPPDSGLPQALVDHYRELLRAYVIMGSGNLAEEMTRLADSLVAAGVTAQRVMLLHLQVLEGMVRGLGNRSARHVMSRADVLILEVMLKLADGYRGRFLRQVQPARQRTLFD